jgi:hypothetical protein
MKLQDEMYDTVNESIWKGCAVSDTGIADQKMCKPVYVLLVRWGFIDKKSFSRKEFKLIIWQPKTGIVKRGIRDLITNLINYRKGRIHQDLSRQWRSCFRSGCEHAAEFTDFNFPQSHSARFKPSSVASLHESISPLKNSVFKDLSDVGQTTVLKPGKRLHHASTNLFPEDGEGRPLDWTNYEPAYTNYISRVWNMHGPPKWESRKQTREQYLPEMKVKTVFDDNRRILSIDPAVEAWLQLQVKSCPFNLFAQSCIIYFGIV